MKIETGALWKKGHRNGRHWFRLMSEAFTNNFAGRHGSVESCSSAEKHLCHQGEIMTLTQRRCPYCDGKNVEQQRTYTIKSGTPRTMYHCASCPRTFSETRHTPLAQLKTPIALVVQVLAALTEGVGINAATRLYGVSTNSIYRWQERLSGVKKHYGCLP
jgi:transposase-like protein